MNIETIQKKIINIMPKIERDLRIYGEAFISISETNEIKLLNPSNVTYESKNKNYLNLKKE